MAKVYLKVVKFRERFEVSWQGLLIDLVCNRKEIEGSEMTVRFFGWSDSRDDCHLLPWEMRWGGDAGEVKVMISRSVSSSPATGSVLTTHSRSCFGFCVSLSLCPSPAHALSVSLSLSLSQK